MYFWPCTRNVPYVSDQTLVGPTSFFVLYLFVHFQFFGQLVFEFLSAEQIRTFLLVPPRTLSNTLANTILSIAVTVSLVVL